jgi:hypothetical protein|nr:MAG TPA: hypothetical protein [Caudoviricetes sp.]
MSIIKFLDSTSSKRKSLIFPAGEDDIIINLPKDSGILATDRLAEKKIRENDNNYDRNIIFILKPDIRENNGGVTATDWDGYFKIASYRVSNGYLGKHTGTEWVAYSDERLTTLVDKSSDDLNKEMWKPNVNIPNLKLYVRYRFVSNSIYSPWSDSIITTTSSGGISPFDVSVEENTLTPGCLISGFKTYGDAIGATHTATTWVVYESINGTLGNKVFDSGKDSVNKTGFTIPNGVLKGDMEYSLQVTLYTDNTKYANSIPYIRKFTTVGAYIHRPILQYKPTKDNQHKIIASEYTSTARNETLVSAVWSLYDADDNRLINTVTNTSSEYDITPFISNNKKYYVTLVYKSNTLTSKEGKCTFNVSGGKAEPIVATFTTSEKKLPILNLSKFYVPGQTDEIKGFAFRIERDMPLHKRKYNRRENWFNGKYNEPMTHTFEVSDFSTFASPDEVWTNEPIKLKGYIIGNKYNSDMFEATFTPSINLNYKVEHIGDDWSNLKFKVSLDNTLDPVNFTPDWVAPVTVQCYRPQGTVPDDGVKEHGTGNYIINVSNYGYEYNKDYTFTIKVYTNIGAKFIDYTLQMEKGIISDPTMEITAAHGYGNYVNMKVKGSEYQYSKPIDSFSSLKEIKLTIQDTTDNNKVVYEKIQTVDDKGPAVYNFDINYDKDHLDKSLKHNTKYLVSIEYKNKRDDRSKRVSKEFTTPERGKITLRSCGPSVTSGVGSFWGTSTAYIPSVELRCDYYSQQDFSNHRLDKIIFRIKKENGDLIKEHTVTIDDYDNGRSNIKVDEFTNIIDYYKVNYNWVKVTEDQWRSNHTMYQNPYFEIGGVYYLEVEFAYEDLTRKESKMFIIMPSYRVLSITSRKRALLKINSIDNLTLRREFFVKLGIDNPNIASGTILNNQQINTIISKELTFTSPHVKLESAAITTGMPIIDTYSMRIITNFRDPNESQVIVNTIDNPRTDPKFIAGSNAIPKHAEASTTILTYNDVKPVIYVTYEDNKWYLVFKYLFFPRNVERNPDFIYPFIYGNYVFKDANNTYFYFNFKYKDEPTLYKSETETLGPDRMDITIWRLHHAEIKRKNPTGEQYKTKYVTTDKFVEGEIGLSNINSDSYKVLWFPEYNDHPYRSDGPNAGKLEPYPTPYLEYLPVDGCKLILSIEGPGNLVRSKLAPEDNLLIQPNPKNGVHFKIYKIETDGTEIELPNILDAFSVGILEPNTTIDNEIYGSWTKPVNKRTVLEHGQLYKVKIWFAPYNNDIMARSLYVEKHFIGYKQPELPAEPDPIPEPNEYNRILQPVGDVNYPLGDFLSFDIIPKTMSQDISLRNRTTRIGREMLPVSMTDMVNAEFQDLGTIPSDEVIACLPSIYAHTFKSTKKATKDEYKRNHAKVKSITVTRKLNTMSGIYRPESMLGGKPADSFSKQKYFTTDDVSKYGFGVISPVTYTKSGIAEFNIREVFGMNYIRSKSAPYLNDDFYGYDVLSFNDGYKELGLTTIAFQCEPTTGYSNYNPSLSNRIKTLFNNNAQDSGDGFMYLYFRDTITNINRFLEVPEGAQKAHNLRTFRGVSIGETYTFKITFEDGKVDTYTKVIRDFTKDAVENGKAILTNEHVAWDKIHNMPSTMPLNIKETFPYASNSEDKIYRALYIYKSSNFGKLDKYGTDCFSLMSAITRSIDTYNDNFLHINLFPAVYPRDVTVSAYYRSGPENSTWEATSPFKKPPVIDLKLFNNPDKDYLTGGGETDRAHRRSTFYNFAFNPYELERKTSTYYTETTTYDMIALVFNYAFYNVYNIIYYRVDRTTGEISYHAEDQDMVFKYEANPQAPLLSNKAMSYIHTVKPNGDIIKGGGEPLTVPTETIGKIRYVVDEKYDNWADGQLLSYLFIEPIPNIKKYEMIGHGSSDWAALELHSTGENWDGYTYGTGYVIQYKNVFINETVYVDEAPDMKIRLTNTSGQIIRLDIKLGNFKRSFPGGKEYEAVITRVEE